jgi:hypothetical protein
LLRYTFEAGCRKYGYFEVRLIDPAGSLPVMLSSGKKEFAAITRNISASGVLFELDRELKAGLEVHFSMRMPGEVLGTPHDVLVQCTGRVVRCSLSKTQYQAASTIDEYQFAEQ